MVNVLFVCLGNICRSPMAEAIFRDKVKKAELAKEISVDSAGTGNWHVGNSPHEGTLDLLGRHRVNADHLIARQVIPNDLQDNDYIIAMDASNIGNLHRMKGLGESGAIFRLLDFVPTSTIEDVPDPYFTGDFNEVFELINEGCERLVTYIKDKENL